MNIKLSGHPMANQVWPVTAFFLMEAVRFDFAVEIVETKYIFEICSVTSYYCYPLILQKCSLVAGAAGF